MKLPDASRAVVERRKMVEYLLNSQHPFGASKARFFSAHGFRQDAWEELGNALREHGMRHDVSSTRETGFGPRYEIDGGLDTPNGSRPLVRTVWQVDHPDAPPRLITAYPLEPR